MAWRSASLRFHKINDEPPLLTGEIRTVVTSPSYGADPGTGAGPWSWPDLTRWCSSFLILTASLILDSILEPITEQLTHWGFNTWCDSMILIGWTHMGGKKFFMFLFILMLLRPGLCECKLLCLVATRWLVGWLAGFPQHVPGCAITCLWLAQSSWRPPGAPPLKLLTANQAAWIQSLGTWAELCSRSTRFVVALKKPLLDWFGSLFLLIWFC